MREMGPLRTLGLWLAGGLVLSLGVVWFATHQVVLTAGFAGGALALGGLVIALAAREQRLPEASLAEPDWTVTVAAIDHGPAAGTVAIAIADRAGRLVCANTAFEQAFGTQPPSAREGDDIASAMRYGWRDVAG